MVIVWCAAAIVAAVQSTYWPAPWMILVFAIISGNIERWQKRDKDGR